MAGAFSDIPVRINSRLVDVDAAWFNALRTAGIKMSGWQKVNMVYTQFQTAAALVSVEGLSLASKERIDNVLLVPSTKFIGGAISAMTAEVGIVGATTKYLGVAGPLNIFQDPGAGVFLSQDASYGPESVGAATSIVVTLRSTGADLSALTQGVMDIWFTTSLFS